MEQTLTIKLDDKNKLHKGECVVCQKEENLVTNLVVFPSGNFAHLSCYPLTVNIK